MSPRDRILARRAKFVAAAIASAGAVSCSSTAAVCLDVAYDGGSDTGATDGAADATDTEPMPCLDPPFDGGGLDSAMPCLSADATFDTGSEIGSDTSVTDSSASDTSATDTEPMPCLSPPFDGG